MYTFVKGAPNWVEPLNENFAEVAALAGAAVPASEKGAAGGVATLDSDGKLAQMPTAEDVGAAAATQFSTASLVATAQFKGANIRVARAGRMVTVTADYITGYAKPSEGGYPVMCTLPQEYRPSSYVDVLLPVSGGGYANVLVEADGNVCVGIIGDAASVTLRIAFSFVQ